MALLGVVIVWLVYRAGRWSERQGVIRALESELDMHKLWLRNPYSADAAGTWTSPDYMPFKLATVAVDNAIVRGPSLFLNPDLGISLVGYRQGASHFNQLIDRVMALQASPELWDPIPQPKFVSYVLTQIEAVHIRGIGDDQLVIGAHALYLRVVAELEREKTSTVLPIIWIATGLNLFFLKGWREPLLRRGQQAWRATAGALRSVARVVSRPKVPAQPGASEKAVEQPPMG